MNWSSGAKASTDPSRWQREQLQAAGFEMSTAASKATAPHWHDPVCALRAHSSAPMTLPLNPKTRRAPA